MSIRDQIERVKENLDMLPQWCRDSYGYTSDAPPPEQQIAELRQQVQKLQAFKDYVHQRLDAMGIAAHPDGEHSKEGCRVGDRIDLVERQLAEAQKASKCLDLIEKFSMTVTRVNSVDGAWRVRAWYQGLRGQLLSHETDDDSLIRAINRAAEFAGNFAAAPQPPTAPPPSSD